MNLAFLLFQPYQCIIQQSGKCNITHFCQFGAYNIPHGFDQEVVKKETVWHILCHTATTAELDNCLLHLQHPHTTKELLQFNLCTKQINVTGHG